MYGIKSLEMFGLYTFCIFLYASNVTYPSFGKNGYMRGSSVSANETKGFSVLSFSAHLRPAESQSFDPCEVPEHIRRCTVIPKHALWPPTTVPAVVQPMALTLDAGCYRPDRKPRYRTYDASPPPPQRRNWPDGSKSIGWRIEDVVEGPKMFVRRSRGECGAVKQVTRDVLSMRPPGGT